MWRNFLTSAPKRKRYFDATLVEFVAPKSGKLEIGSGIATVCGTTLSNVEIFRVEKICLKSGERIRQRTFKFERQDKTSGTVIEFIVVMFVPDPNTFIETAKKADGDATAMKTFLSHIFSKSKGATQPNVSSSYFKIFEIDFKSTGRSEVEQKLGSVREYFFPAPAEAEVVTLSTRLQSHFLCAEDIPSKFIVSIELKFSRANSSRRPYSSEMEGHPPLSVSKTASSSASSSSSANGARRLKDNSQTEDGLKHSAALRNIYFHYLFNPTASDTSCFKSVVEHHVPLGRLACPFCSFSVHLGNSRHTGRTEPFRQPKVKLAICSFLTHLEYVHFLFRYEAVVDQLGDFHVVVRRDAGLQPTATVRAARVDYCFSNRRQIKRNRRPSTVPIYEACLPCISFPNPSRRDPAAPPGVSGSHGVSHASSSNDWIKKHKRQYFHARLALPITDEEFLSYDSDDDIDTSFEKVSAVRGIDEFEDICVEEKELMKLWNVFCASYPPFSSSYVALACELFCRRFSAIIHSKGLRHNLLLHFLSLSDANLLSVDDIVRLMAIVDADVAQTQVSSAAHDAADIKNNLENMSA